MEIYTVSLLGSKKINRHYEIEAILEDIVKDIITSKGYVEFLVCREGEFDLIAASVIRRVKRRKGYKNCSLNLVLPYETEHFRNNEKSYLEYYDNVEILSKSDEKHIKEAFQMRNEYMVDSSDMVIFCVERNKGSAYQAKRYAETSRTEIVELTAI